MSQPTIHPAMSPAPLSQTSVRSPSNRRRKRRRFDEIPILARSYSKSWLLPIRTPGLINKVRSSLREETPPVAADFGLLGPWEDSITSFTPSSEQIDHLSDFIYKHVVDRFDVDAGLAAFGLGAGAIIEIEAKIGHFVDKRTNNRLRRSVTAEYVLDKSDPDLRVNFKSSMTDVRSLLTSLSLTY